MSIRPTWPAARCIDFVKVQLAGVWMASSLFWVPGLLPIVRRMPVIDGQDSVPDLLELVSQAHVLEVLDALIRGPMRRADLRTHVHAGRRGLAAALRLLGGRGLVTRNDHGSWDTDAPAHIVYRLTDLGRVVVEALSCYSLWTAMYDRVEASQDHCWNR